MEEIKQLISDRLELKRELARIEQLLAEEIFNLPKEVLILIAAGIVKPNFPIPNYVFEELTRRVKNFQKD